MRFFVIFPFLQLSKSGYKLIKNLNKFSLHNLCPFIYTGSVVPADSSEITHKGFKCEYLPLMFEQKSGVNKQDFVFSVHKILLDVEK